MQPKWKGGRRIKRNKLEKRGGQKKEEYEVRGRWCTKYRVVSSRRGPRRRGGHDKKDGELLEKRNQVPCTLYLGHDACDTLYMPDRYLTVRDRYLEVSKQDGRGTWRGNAGQWLGVQEASGVGYQGFQERYVR